MALPGPEQVLREWQQALARMASAAFGDADIAELLRAPMEAQVNLLKQAFDQQMAFQRALADRMSEPLTRSRELLDDVAHAMHTQAGALRQAGAAFEQIAALLEYQASLLAQAGEALGQSSQLLRTVVAPIAPGDDTAPGP